MEPPQTPKPSVNRWFTLVTMLRAILRLPNGEKMAEDALSEAKRKEAVNKLDG